METNIGSTNNLPDKTEEENTQFEEQETYSTNNQSNNNNRNHILICILGVVCILLIGALIGIILGYHADKANWQNAKVVIISKQDLRLRVFDYNGKCLFDVPCAVGRAEGNKQCKGDNKTPEGVFHLQDKQNSENWTHDFGDGEGVIEGAYGPRFLRLSVPGHKGIGIHGTHLPESVGTRASEGCIRLKNEDVLALDELITIPCTVIITPGVDDVVVDVDADNDDTKVVNRQTKKRQDTQK